MHIERNYYTAARQLMERLRREAAAEQPLPNSPEQTAECERLEREISELIAKKAPRQPPRRASARRAAQFRRLANDVVNLAHACGLDVCMDQPPSGRWGTVQLQANYLLLNDLCPASARATLLRLFRQAYEASLDTEGDTFILEFRFDLASP